MCERYHYLYNQRIERMHPLISPQALAEKIPMSEKSFQTVKTGRKEVEAILKGSDKRFLLIVGPCSIHDRISALDYAARLMRMREQYRSSFCIIMRTYFEKPRTNLGWRGLITEPQRNGCVNMAGGLEMARRILSEITEMGLPAATELLDPIVPQYISDFISWASIGARSAESQIPRELASGLSMPVGFKNPTDGRVAVAVNAIVAAQKPHAFIGIMPDGYAAVVHTAGNETAHLVLRGGSDSPNYDRISIEKSCQELEDRGIHPALLIDCSHGNSQKDPARQCDVLLDTLRLRVTDPSCAAIRGCMIESFIRAGSISSEYGTQSESYGTSITDPCMSWEMTEAVLSQAADLWRL